MQKFPTLIRAASRYDKGASKIVSVEYEELSDGIYLQYLNTKGTVAYTQCFKSKAELTKFCLNLISVSEGEDEKQRPQETTG
jgi:hypothetical protein